MNTDLTVLPPYMALTEQLKNQIRALPDSPGVYQYYNADDTLIYVGKAKSLRKRVASYFSKKSGGIDRKTRRLVSQIAAVRYTVVATEYEALLLENNLIKQHQPRYNISLRDDKTYPYILVTNDRFPKIYPTRRRIEGRGTYFGPYASPRTMHTLIDLIRKVFTIRICNLKLSEENIRAEKFKVCLEYHIGNCRGPCQALQAEADYLENIEAAKRVLRGNLSAAKAHLKGLMATHAANMEFERAALIKQKLDLLEKHETRSTVVNPSLGDLDVFTALGDDVQAFVNYMQVRGGAIVQTQTLTLKRVLDEPLEQILVMAMASLRDRLSSQVREVITNQPVDYPEDGVRVSQPQIGDKKRLIDLSIKNILYYKRDRELRRQAMLNQEEGAAKGPLVAVPAKEVLLRLQQDLHLTHYPDHIECFDNSNTQGTEPVAAMVCFRDGVPSKRDYRHYIVRTVKGPDDFASMREIVGRRYRRLIDEGQPLPKLIVIDGGKGQLSAAVEALRSLSLYGKIPIVGIAKRLEEIYFPEDPYPKTLDRRSESLKLLQRLRDEAHRFGITHHRDRRSQASLKLSVEQVPGIGPKTLEKLQRRFGSLRSIKAEDLPEVETLIGKSRTAALARHLELEAGLGPTTALPLAAEAGSPYQAGME